MSNSGRPFLSSLYLYPFHPDLLHVLSDSMSLRREDTSSVRRHSSVVSSLSSVSSIDSQTVQSDPPAVPQQQNPETGDHRQSFNAFDGNADAVNSHAPAKIGGSHVQERFLSNTSDASNTNHHQTRRSSLSDVLFNWWLLELSGMVLSVGATFAIVGVVIQYHNRPLEDWPYRITINTLVSFLNSLAKGAMLLVVASAVSQLKWLWFHQSKAHSLNDIQLIDSASRGPLGALQLIWHTPRMDLASFSAVIIILSFGMDPFTQQILSFP